MKTVRLYLLDRNAVNCIKNSCLGKEPSDPKKIELLSKLRSLDKDGNNVSPLLSIIEGELGREDSPEEKKLCALKEIEVLKEFYQKAHIPENIQSDPEIIGDTFSNNREKDWEIRKKFLEYALPLLSSNGVAKNKRGKIEQDLLQHAIELGLHPGQPTVMIALAALYGGKAARKVLKPHAPNLYNTLSDIHAISRLLRIFAEGKRRLVELEVELVTGDEGLNEIFQGITLTDVAFGRNGVVNFQTKYSTALFNELSQDEAVLLMNRVLKTQRNK